MSKDALRLADSKIYNDSHYFDNPKEYFKLILEKILSYKRPDEKFRIIDIGCSNGALLNFLKRTFVNAELIGVEPLESLIKVGQKLNSEIKFINSGLMELDLHDKLKGDFVICSGVIGIFNNPDLFVSKLMKLVNSNGKIFIFSPFNEEPIDVILKYKYSSNKNWETGHNLFSMKTMQDIAGLNKVDFEWFDFRMPFEIVKTSDPMRSWTEPFRDNPYCLFYGTNMFSTMKLLILNKGK